MKGRTALVLGAGGGLGGAIARSLATEGAKVAVADIDAAAAAATAEAVVSAGGEAIALEWDLSRIDGVDDKVAEVESRLGAVPTVTGTRKEPHDGGVDKGDWRTSRGIGRTPVPAADHDVVAVAVESRSTALAIRVLEAKTPPYP